MSAFPLSREDRSLSAFAAVTALLVFVVVAASAWLRLAAVPCPPGGCEGFSLADGVRLAHRVAAMGVSILALVIAALAWKAPARPSRRFAAVAILVLVVVLALVGRGSAGNPPPAVVLTNVLGGLTLLAVTAGLAAAARTPAGRPSIRVATAAAVLVLATATGGVLAAAPPADPSALALLHRAAAWGTLAALFLASTSSSIPQGARIASRITLALVALQLLLALAANGWPMARWLHNLLTAASICAAIVAVLSSRAGTPPAPGGQGVHPARA